MNLLGRDHVGRKLEVVRSVSPREVVGLALRMGAGAGIMVSLAESCDSIVVLIECFITTKLVTPKIIPEMEAQE